MKQLLSQFGKLPAATKLLLCLCIITQLNGLAIAESDQKDSKLDSLDSISKLGSSEIENAKSIDFELLSKAGDEDLARREDSMREILNAEESMIKEVKVEPPSSGESRPDAAAAATVDELKTDLKMAELKEAESVTGSPSISGAEQPLAQSSPANLTSDQLAKESAPVADQAVSSDKSAMVADGKPADAKADSSSANNEQAATTTTTAAVSSGAAVASEKKEGKPERLAEDKDPLTSASSNVDNVKNEEEKKRLEEEISIEDKAPVVADKIESKDLEATHRESDSSELNIEESSKCLFFYGLCFGKSFFSPALVWIVSVTPFEPV